ncbi:DUF2867 domain-containing protein [Klebsiella michiganensis]|uniref:DUF2867 domain-containing protein n=1 Tax=Klebsiella michiganensis TaxID=1134687 RepID=UPI003EC0549E
MNSATGATMRRPAAWRPEYGYYPKQASCPLTLPQPCCAVEGSHQIGGKEGYFFGNVCGKRAGRWICCRRHRLAKGRPEKAYLQTGDAVDSWKVIIVAGKAVDAVIRRMKAPGLGALSFTLRDKGDHRELDVRAWWHPHVMPGLFYWLLNDPAASVIFRGMARRSPHHWRSKSPSNRV